MSNPSKQRSWVVFVSLFCVLSLILIFGLQVTSVYGGSGCQKTCMSQSDGKSCSGNDEVTLKFAKKGSASQNAQIPDLKSFKKEQLYTCPMHPEVREKKSGKCPQCGMDLVKEEFYKVYTCTNKECPKVSAKADKCCGKDLKMTRMSKKEYYDFTQEQEYFCPMHPDVVSKQAGKCPKCGMNLEKRIVSKAEEKTEAK